MRTWVSRGLALPVKSLHGHGHRQAQALLVMAHALKEGVKPRDVMCDVKLIEQLSIRVADGHSMLTTAISTAT